MNIISKAEWNNEKVLNGEKAAVSRYDAFGWKVYKHVLPVDGVMLTTSSVQVSRDRAPNRCMFVRGRATAVDSTGTLKDYTPGTYTQELPALVAGVTKLTATEEFEYWCFNYVINRNALPELTPVRLVEGESYELKTGELLFAMLGKCGDLQGPASYVPDHDITITAESPFYAFIVAQRRT